MKCNICDNDAHFMCSVCDTENAAYYCSETCQKQDWKQHKQTCASQKHKTQNNNSNSIAAATTSSNNNIQQENVNTSSTFAASSSSIEKSLNRSLSRKKVHGRGNAAQAINTKHQNTSNTALLHNNNTDTRQNNQRQGGDNNNNNNNNDEEKVEITLEEEADDLKFYMSQIYLIIKPVMLCILLSILWVKFTNPISQYYTFTARAPQTPGGTPGGGGIPAGGAPTSPPTQEEFGTSLRLALIILGQIVGATIVILLLFKYGCMKILYGIFGTIVLLLLGLFGFILGSQLLVTFNLSLDWISFIFMLWNLVFSGLVQIFWKGPLKLQQAYLVLVSSLMAYSLTQTLELTTWILLALLAVWDLIAVLCPFGPLRLLVESSRDQNREIPALLYTVMIWMMASGGERRRSSDNNVRGNSNDNDSTAPLTIHNDQQQHNGVYGTDSNATPIVDPGEIEIDEEDERSGLKLGLGDFVFYSVLVARGALFDWTTTICCTFAVMTGLNMTIFLLAIYKKALPALPISIAFGILFYFLSSRMLTPFLNSLILVTQPDEGFRIGKGGGGMIYI